MKNRYYITIIIALLTLVSCQKEELYTGPCNVRLRLAMQEEVSVTRAPEYKPISNAIPDFTAELFVSDGVRVGSTTMEWDGDKVNANLKLEEGTYNFYGYMPKRGGASFDLSTKEMTIPVIAGFGKENAMLIKGNTPLVINAGDKTGSTTLHMDHLMAKVTPYFYVHDEYAKMRTIKIKKVEFSMSDAATYTATVDYKTTPPTTKWQGGATAAVKLTTFENEFSPKELDQNADAKGEALPTECFYLCPAQSTANLKMTVTYDVYDEKEEMTREDITADNAILKLNTLKAGTNYKLYIKVVPTYLYVLSDNDEVSVLKIND